MTPRGRAVSGAYAVENGVVKVTTPDGVVGTGDMKLSGGNLSLSLVVLAHYVAAPPDPLDVVLATRCVGQFIPQLADEDVDELHLSLVQAAIEVAQKHFLS
jgi:hypothetical protein